MQCATIMRLLNIGKQQFALFDIKQTWFITALQLIVYSIATTLTSSDCKIEEKIIKLFKFFFSTLIKSRK